MKTLKLDTNGRVTLGADLLNHLGVQRGGELLVSRVPNGAIELRAMPNGKISDAFGYLRAKTDGRALSIDEIGEISGPEWAGKR